jgi:hypothetical protein
MNSVNLKLLVEASKCLPDPAYAGENSYFVDVRSRLENLPLANPNKIDRKALCKVTRVEFVKVFYVIRGRKVHEWELVV